MEMEVMKTKRKEREEKNGGKKEREGIEGAATETTIIMTERIRKLNFIVLSRRIKWNKKCINRQTHTKLF